jgi:hypothetical protein
MALFSECMPWCARKQLDTADIVRDAIFRQLRPEARKDLAVIRKHNPKAALTIQPHLLHDFRAVFRSAPSSTQ